jgi:hypothetical protein
MAGNKFVKGSQPDSEAARCPAGVGKTITGGMACRIPDPAAQEIVPDGISA